MVGKLKIAFGKAVIKESGNMLKNISQILRDNECFGQLAASKAIASERHVRHAVGQTLWAFENKRNFVESKELELLIRLSGIKNAQKAIGAIGIREGEQEIAIIAFGERPEKALKEIKALIGFKEARHSANIKELERLFGIGKKELAAFKDRKKALESAVIEKIALLELEH